MSIAFEMQALIINVDADVAIHGPVHPQIASVLAHAAIGLMMMLLSS